MIEIKKSVLVPYSPDKMYNLVTDIKNYPKYLPWCSNSAIKAQIDNTVTARVDIEYLMVKTHFTTKNTNYPYEKIDMQLVDGPFKYFAGSWNFTPLGDNGCKIEFCLNYKFSNFFIEKIIGPVFSYISKNIVDCFIKEAHKLYAKPAISE
ncbi:MAG: ubiquinone-binding protein [Burkholderiales bacterium]|jgi:ribosome-associated toxin RatA of RatAB toxin-antitoxin module|nr:ubiquinone-binding protein [Burkholderiales bacterium]